MHPTPPDGNPMLLCLRVPILLLMAMAATAGTARPAAAQQVPSPYRYIETAQETGLFAGFVDMDRGRFGFGPGPGPIWGGRYGVHVSDPIVLEATLSHMPTTRDVIDPDLPEGERAVAEAEVQLVTLDARLRFNLTGRRSWNGLVPYVFGGGGVGFDAAGDQIEDEQLFQGDRFDYGTSFLGVFGAGARWSLSERLAVRLDGVVILSQLDVPRGYGVEERDFENVPESEWVNSPGLTFGLSYLF